MWWPGQPMVETVTLDGTVGAPRGGGVARYDPASALAPPESAAHVQTRAQPQKCYGERAPIPTGGRAAVPQGRGAASVAPPGADLQQSLEGDWEVRWSDSGGSPSPTLPAAACTSAIGYLRTEVEHNRRTGLPERRAAEMARAVKWALVTRSSSPVSRRRPAASSRFASAGSTPPPRAEPRRGIRVRPLLRAS